MSIDFKSIKDSNLIVNLILMNNITVKEMINKYAEQTKTPIDIIGKNIFLIYHENNLEINSNEKICNILNNIDTIFIKEKKEEELNFDIINSKRKTKVSLRQSNFRNRKENEEVKDTLKDMSIFGCIERINIEDDIIISKEKFISIDECINSNEKSLFILGVLAKYLEVIGIKTVIEKDINQENKDEIEGQIDYSTLLQFICNGYILKDKYILDFELSKERVEELYNEKFERKKFKKNLKKIIIEHFQKNEEDLIVTNIRKNRNYFTIVLVFKSDLNEEITKENLINLFKNDLELKKLISIEKVKIIEGIRLSKSLLYPKGNTFDDKKYGYNETRGGEKYFPPLGWHRYGLKVLNKYDDQNNDWIGYKNKPGEWCISYSGLSFDLKKINEKSYEFESDIRHNGKKVGLGVYTSPNPEIMEKITEKVNINENMYKIGLMLRVKPDKIRCPESNKNLWIVNGTSDEIRPYGILLKKI